MSSTNESSTGFRFPILQGVLPIKRSQIPVEIIAGLTLAGFLTGVGIQVALGQISGMLGLN